ncbi:unnamed protein product [Urochloa humidicola]
MSPDTKLLLDAMGKLFDEFTAGWLKQDDAREASGSAFTSTEPSVPALTTTSFLSSAVPDIAVAVASPAASPDRADEGPEAPPAARVHSTAAGAAGIVDGAEPLSTSRLQPGAAAKRAILTPTVAGMTERVAIAGPFLASRPQPSAAGEQVVAVPLHAAASSAATSDKHKAATTSSSALTPAPAARAAVVDIANTTPTRCSTLVPTPTPARINIAAARTTWLTTQLTASRGTSVLVARGAEEDIVSNSLTTCSTNCFIRGINVLQSMDVITTIWMVPQISFCFTDGTSLDCSFENLQERLPGTLVD